MWVERSDFASHSHSRHHIERTTKAKLDRFDPAVAEQAGAVFVLSNDDPLMKPGAPKRNHQTSEKSFCAAKFCACHNL
jgi:hypothetical protein